MEQRFELTKPLLGRKRGSVSVGTVVRVEHPLLKQPVDVPLHEIAGVIPVPEAASEELPLLVRDPTVLPIVSMATSTPNVVIVLRSPMTVTGFKLGSDRFFPITGRQRRRGLDVDLFTVCVAHPVGLVAAMQAAGLDTTRSLADVLRSVVGEAFGPQADERTEALRRSTGRASLMIFGLGLALAAAGAARGVMGNGDASASGDTVGRAVGSAMAAAIGFGALVALAAPRAKPGHPPRSDRSVALRAILIGFGLLAVWLAAVSVTRDWVGPGHVLSRALFGAVLGGYLVSRGFVGALNRRRIRSTMDRGPQSPEPSVVSGSERSVLVVIAVIGLIGAVVIALGEPGNPADLALARAAVVTVHDLPPGRQQPVPATIRTPSPPRSTSAEGRR